MLTKIQLRILSVFKKDLPANLTFKQIKQISNQKSNNSVQLALKEFKKQKIVKTSKTGNVTTYTINLDNNLTLAYLNLINEAEISKYKLPIDLLCNIQNRILKHTEYFSLIVFGSYAKKKTNSKSDLDFAIIMDSKQTGKNIEIELETIKRREIIPIDYHIFTREEFQEMLEAEMENVGKQIVEHNIVFYGYIPYIHLITRWAKHNYIFREQKTSS